MNPYYIAMSELILSEAVFVPLMLLTLWGLAVLWRPADGTGCAETHFVPWRGPDSDRNGCDRRSRHPDAAVLGGSSCRRSCSSGSSMVSFALCDVRLRRTAFQGGVLVVVGAVLTMSPWWARNARTDGPLCPHGTVAWCQPL